MSGGFWRKLWDNYCDVTNFHGFRELNAYDNWWNRIYWTASILGGFAFTLALMMLGIQNYLHDPVMTHTTFKQNGNIDTSVMYCPTQWASGSAVDKYDPTRVQMAYALSFLSLRYGYSDLLYPIIIHRSLNATIDRSFVCRIPIATTLRGSTLPPYYKSSAKTVIRRLLANSRRGLSERALLAKQGCPNCPTSPLNFFYAWLYKTYICKEKESVLYICYHYLLMNEDDQVIKSNYNETLSAYVNMQGKVSYNPYTYGCFTLQALDKLELMKGLNETEFREAIFNETRCDTLLEEYRRLTKTSPCNVSDNNLQMEYLVDRIFGETDVESLYVEDVYTLRRTSQMWEHLFKDSHLEAHRAAVDSNATDREALIAYLTAQPDLTELNRLLRETEIKYLEREEKSFHEFLKTNNFSSPFEFLMAVAFDEKDFLVWLTTSPFKISPVEYSNVEVKRVFVSGGVCFQFHITASPKHKIDELYSVEFQSFRTYYVNVVQISNSPDTLENQGVLAVLDSVHDQALGMYSNVFLDYYNQHTTIQPKGIHAVRQSGQFAEDLFAVTGDLFDYQSLTLSTIEKQKLENRRGARCKENTTEEDETKYTYNNCRNKCFNYFLQPKLVWQAMDGKVRYPIGNCYYEKLGVPNLITKSRIPICSYFSNMRQVWQQWEQYPYLFLGDDHIQENLTKNAKLHKCLQSCIKPCKQETRQIKYSRKKVNPFYYVDLLRGKCPINHSERLNGTNSKGPLSLPCVEQLKSMHNYYEMTADDFISAMCDNRYCVNRIELEIHTDSVLYEEKYTFTWFDMFGLVGGQIGLVMGASCLTLMQVIWVIVKTMHDIIERKRSRRAYWRNVERKESRYAILVMNDIPLLQKETEIHSSELERLKLQTQIMQLQIQKLEEALQQLSLSSSDSSKDTVG